MPRDLDWKTSPHNDKHAHEDVIKPHGKKREIAKKMKAKKEYHHKGEDKLVSYHERPSKSEM